MVAFGQAAHSFRTLVAELGTVELHDSVARGEASPIRFQKVNEASPLQAEAFRLLERSQF
jgi:hypothetical protein